MIFKPVDVQCWHKFFVIFPRKTICGNWVAFEYVLRRFNRQKYLELDFTGHSYSVGGWEYKLD